MGEIHHEMDNALLSQPAMQPEAVAASLIIAVDGRVNLTLQYRLVKELRLRGISTKEAANGYAPHFIADFNGRVGKAPRSGFDAHRQLRADDDLDLILTVRVPRRVSKVLTVQYDPEIYLLEDTVVNRSQIHNYLGVFEYPDGRIEIRVDGAALCPLRPAIGD
ncbi:hypothetical protein [Paraburkholderia sp. D1E]|uniref:hypothetical protein n=1 Tax=Paraburkholderia sp. D1E TaxID=3461398 RepID=UPI004045F2F3